MANKGIPLTGFFCGERSKIYLKYCNVEGEYSLSGGNYLVANPDDVRLPGTG